MKLIFHLLRLTSLPQIIGKLLFLRHYELYISRDIWGKMSEKEIFKQMGLYQIYMQIKLCKTTNICIPLHNLLDNNEMLFLPFHFFVSLLQQLF